jgi:hypothetical protein
MILVIRLCVEKIPPALVPSYTDYLRTSLEPVDFMPCPKPFLAGEVPEEVFNRRKRELRPRYLRLYRLVKERASSVQSDGYRSSDEGP